MLPLHNSLKRAIQEVRDVAYQGNLQTATTRTDLILPEAFTVLGNGENFLLFDSGNKIGRAHV